MHRAPTDPALMSSFLAASREGSCSWQEKLPPLYIHSATGEKPGQGQMDATGNEIADINGEFSTLSSFLQIEEPGRQHVVATVVQHVLVMAYGLQRLWLKCCSFCCCVCVRHMCLTMCGVYDDMCGVLYRSPAVSASFCSAAAGVGSLPDGSPGGAAAGADGAAAAPAGWGGAEGPPR
jgi:hypothetical protein